jgi:hypothetical protein
MRLNLQSNQTRQNEPKINKPRGIMLWVFSVRLCNSLCVVMSFLSGYFSSEKRGAFSAVDSQLWNVLSPYDVVRVKIWFEALNLCDASARKIVVKH